MSPNQPATPNRNFRASDGLWEFVERMAGDDGVSKTALLLSLIAKEARRRYPHEDVPPR